MIPRKRWLINGAFALLCLALLTILYLAPEETTVRLPHDDTHEKFHAIASKKEADTRCVACHAEGAVAPLPAEHPPPYRCLFCHKRE